MLDYCCGLEWWNSGVYDVFEREPLRDAVIMVNFMRGRDAFWNDHRDMLKQAGLLQPMWRCRTDGDGTDMACIHSDVNHRAYQYLLAHTAELASIALLGSPGIEDETDYGLSSGTKCKIKKPIRVVDPSDERHALYNLVICRTVIDVMQAKFFSYQSTSGLRFDSAVHVHHRRQSEI